MQNPSVSKMCGINNLLKASSFVESLEPSSVLRGSRVEAKYKDSVSDDGILESPSTVGKYASLFSGVAEAINPTSLRNELGKYLFSN